MNKMLKLICLKIRQKKYSAISIFIVVGIVLFTGNAKLSSNNKGIVINRNKILGSIQKNKIGVYIDGEVNNKGYIKIKKGSTLEFAINKAGGVTKDADIQNIDLNRVLKNQEKIIIPKNKRISDKEEMKTDTININTANKEELMELEGIGATTAENIIKYRENKPFNAVEEIMEVKGIGSSKFEKIKENITV